MAKLRRRALIGLLVALTIWGWVDVRRRGYLHPGSPQGHKTDLTVYTEAGAAFFDGRPPYEVSNPRGWTYLYPPMFALLLAPLHVMPMQDQVTLWFFISLLFCWGCWRQMRLLITAVNQRQADSAAIADWKISIFHSRVVVWLVIAATATALLPTLNCLQRGQVGVIKLYLLLLGARLLLGGRSRSAWLAGGVVLAMPIVLKIVPALPVGFLLLLLLLEAAKEHWTSGRWLTPAGERFALSSCGVVCGLLLFFLLIPAALIGWENNLYHLDTWSRFMLTKADDGGMDPRSGNSHSARNQSLHNAVYRLGNFIAYETLSGPDDRLVERFDAPRMAMDNTAVERCLLGARTALVLALLALGLKLGRGSDFRFTSAVGFSMACVTMLVVSPVARGHYFMLWAPAVIFVPLRLQIQGWPRAAVALAVAPPVLSLSHYLLLPLAGRIGLMGLGTAAWLMAALALLARSERHKVAAVEVLTLPDATIRQAA